MLKKIGFLLPLLGLVLTSTVYAYSGSHDFLEMAIATSDDHTYVCQYKSKGTFPYNGAGIDDNAPVDLKGILTVSMVDGTSESASYCFKLNGGLSNSGGQVEAIRYSDRGCRKELERKTYTVTSYNEDEAGHFTFVANDEMGVEWNISGVHEFGAKKGKGKN